MITSDGTNNGKGHEISLFVSETPVEDKKSYRAEKMKILENRDDLFLFAMRSTAKKCLRTGIRKGVY